jgi:hypothetical protein
MDDWLKEFEIGETTWRRHIAILEQEGAMVRGYFRALDISWRVVRKPFWKRKS